jgi:hypothetical protein
MPEFKIGDSVKAVGVKGELDYEGVIIKAVPLGDDQLCTIAIVERAGFMPDAKFGATLSRFLAKVDTTRQT